MQNESAKPASEQNEAVTRNNLYSRELFKSNQNHTNSILDKNKAATDHDCFGTI